MFTDEANKLAVLTKYGRLPLATKKVAGACQSAAIKRSLMFKKSTNYRTR